MFVLTLIGMLDDGEMEFIQKLYIEYKPLVRRKIKDIIGNSSEIEDLINDTFLKLAKQISILKTLNDPKRIAYIAITSKRVAINFIKQRDTQNKYIYYGWEDDIGTSIEEEEDSRYKEDDLTIQMLIDAVQRLPEKEKSLLYFKYYLEMTDMEIAEEIGINPNSVREYLTRVRRKAKVLMEKEKNDANKS